MMTKTEKHGFQSYTVYLWKTREVPTFPWCFCLHDQVFKK